MSRRPRSRGKPAVAASARPLEPYRAVVNTVSGRIIRDTKDEYWYELQTGALLKIDQRKAAVILRSGRAGDRGI